jgi:lipoic acid synthetase
MIMGNVCTRNCRFCAVAGGAPHPLDETEPERLAEAARRMHLEHVVITSVTRDDIAGGGAEHFAKTIRAIRKKLPATIEVLVPDFEGSKESIETVLDAQPDIFNHNVETVRRLYPIVRPQADYERSLSVLSHAYEYRRDIPTKSGLMVGLGESDEEVRQVIDGLVAARCSVITIGQYLAPSREHLPVERFVHPETFKGYCDYGAKKGVLVFAGPFVRSSYNAAEVFEGLKKRDVHNP